MELRADVATTGNIRLQADEISLIHDEMAKLNELDRVKITHLEIDEEEGIEEIETSITFHSQNGEYFRYRLTGQSFGETLELRSDQVMFKVGDKVRVVKKSDKDIALAWRGATGQVTRVYPDCTNCGYDCVIRLDRFLGAIAVYFDELEAA